ncbi:MAG: CorA family divalent cation transporter, partial [Dehalococcoidia bacterium]
MTEVTDLIEDEALANPNPALLEHLIRLKRSVMRMHRVIGPQRDLLAQISRGTYPLLGNDSAMFFRDIYDHLLRLDDMTVNLRDRADHAVTTYHSALSIKQNETMRVLAIVASIFLPLTLLAGIYGMNFKNMPELDTQYGYFVVLGVIIVVVAGGTYAIFGRALMGWSRDRIGNLVSFALEPPTITETIHEASRLRSRVLQQASKITRR